jgi:streptomycin 6-kinase
MAGQIRTVPFDPALPTLAAALDPERSAPLLTEALGVQTLRLSQVDLLRLKPGRRALVAYHLDPAGAEVVLGKVRAKGLDRRSFEAQRDLYRHGFTPQSRDGIAVPEPLGCIPPLAMWLQRRVPGRALSELLFRPEATWLMVRTAQALDKLHGCSLTPPRRHTPADEMATLEAALTQVAAERPQWKAALGEVVTACRALLASVGSGADAPLHRDFYPDQVLVDGDRLTLVDFDLFAAGDPALDVGNFVAHIEEQALRSGAPASLDHLIRTFVGAYLAFCGADLSERIEAYATLTLARHIYISTRFAERRATTEPLLRLCQRRLGLRAPAVGGGWHSSRHRPRSLR